jgi:hypothetical protein
LLHKLGSRLGGALMMVTTHKMIHNIGKGCNGWNFWSKIMKNNLEEKNKVFNLCPLQTSFLIELIYDEGSIPFNDILNLIINDYNM